MGGFQMLSGGKIVQVPAIGGCAQANIARPNPAIAPHNLIFSHDAASTCKFKLASRPVSGYRKLIRAEFRRASYKAPSQRTGVRAASALASRSSAVTKGVSVAIASAT